jgi:hypothetical protein
MENNILNIEMIIMNSINNIFPNLNEKDKLILKLYMNVLLCVIVLLFNSNGSDISTPNALFIEQFSQNNYRDTKWLLLQLLPYINGETKNITELKNILIEKEENIDINKAEPKYKYSNVQYGRFFRNKNNFTEFKDIDSYIKHNFYLLINTIKTMSHKLFPNWINILPYSLKDYNVSSLFIKTQEALWNNDLRDWDPVNIKVNDSYKEITDKIEVMTERLDMNDIYNTISVELYENIEPMKWMIYDINYGNSFTPLITLLNEILDLKHCLQSSESEWNQLSDHYKTTFTNKLYALIDNFNSGSILIYDNRILPNKSIKMIFNAIISQFNSSKYLKEAMSDGYIKSDNIAETDLKTLKSEYLHNFINDSIKKIVNTWYGYKLLNPEKNTFKTWNDLYHVNYTLKNVYNFAKSVVHLQEKDKYLRLPNMWCSLENSQKIKVLEKLNSNDGDWFDITGDLRKIGIDVVFSKDVNEINNEIFTNVRSNLIKIIFQSLKHKWSKK